MKVLVTLMTIGLMIITAGCHFEPKVSREVNYDYNVNYDFSNLSTYDWKPISTAAGLDKFTASRIKKAVDDHMLAKGLTITSDRPDVLVMVYGGANKMPTTNWRGFDAPLYYEKGRIHFALLDPKTDNVIWWGKADAKLDPTVTPEEEDEVINDVVNRLFEKFPPEPPNPSR